MCGFCGGEHNVSDACVYDDHPLAEDGEEVAEDEEEEVLPQQHMLPTTDLASPHPQELLQPSFRLPSHSQPQTLQKAEQPQQLMMGHLASSVHYSVPTLHLL
jgi:hypothetical protein